ISIHTRLIDRPEEGKVVEVRIDDEGRGLDDEIRDHIFEPFISSKHTVGVGMGLTVARHALRNLGGEVTVVDREGGGASVFLTHPLESRRQRKNHDE
ncbi:MAG TPA: ATP-binding protein, partial [Opitutus sp.]|nr:ATP-binding protein [Opitutus sp.]